MTKEQECACEIYDCYQYFRNEGVKINGYKKLKCIHIVCIIYIIYICININVNLGNMDKTKVITKRKIINIRPETEKKLRLIAVNYGQNLKSYIESVLEELANEDEILIALSKAPGMDDILNQSEKDEFLKSLSA